MKLETHAAPRFRKSVFDEVARNNESMPARAPTFACGGMASTPHPFVTEAALEVLREGGNAVDAAIAAAGVMICAVPLASHFGGDAFCLIHSADGKVHAINGSGAAPAAATLDYFRKQGGFPNHGLSLSTVPGVPAAWSEANARFGTKPLSTLLRRAIMYARSGVPVTARLHQYLANSTRLFERYPASAAIFLPNGNAPEIGDLLPQRQLAAFLERFVDEPDAFYRGNLAQEMAAFSKANDGLLATEDFSAHTCEIYAPISIRYRNFRVFSEAPVSRGIITLLALKILERFDIAQYSPLSAPRYHLLVEAYKLALEDLAKLGDPRFVDNVLGELLSDEHATAQAARIDTHRAKSAVMATTSMPSTESAVFGDAEGNVVAYIQSIYMGCGMVMADTGMLMNARMTGFSLDPSSPNVVAARKRPMHTLNNYVVHDAAGELVLAGGTPGGELQVQMNLQILSNILDHGMSVTEAIDHPRFAVGGYYPDEIPLLRIESRVDSQTIESLAALGHRVEPMGPWEPLSGVAVHVIARNPRTGVYSGGSESRRADSVVSGF